MPFDSIACTLGRMLTKLSGCSEIRNIITFPQTAASADADMMVLRINEYTESCKARVQEVVEAHCLAEK